ncbi:MULTISPECIES: hypothetical protein [unclassified Streptosporangium]|uniref:hypothetical protein n=1 Tax=unclassified Streptosporangium TaxID=2632669 RepID=UPI002E2B9C92|nr:MULTISPECIES: hypothetical protein [unclassified Streptosporangium]
MNDARARLRYLDQTLDLLFPGPGDPSPYTLLPHRLLPRRLVPRAWWHPGGRVTVPSGRDGIESHLSEVFGTPVRVTLRVRPARRANRKPILEARAADGPIAFVKIGDTDLTRELVAHEARTLSLLAAVPLKTVVPPAVLHHGSWRGLSVLALTPLPVRRGRIPGDVLTDAIAEIARIPGDHLPDRAPLGDPAKGNPARGNPAPGDPLPGDPARVGQAPGNLAPAGQAPGDACTGQFPEDASASRGPEEPPGDRGFSWHGDLTPWNISRGPDGRLLVWDWERFGTGVPLGFDAVHHFFQRALRRDDPAIAARACVAGALRILAPFGLSAAESRLTALRYLIALADRHAADGHAPLGPPELWLTPLADSQEILL